MKDSLFGDLSVIGMPGCESFVGFVDSYLKDSRREEGDDVKQTYTVRVECPRFGSGEGKGLVHESMRGKDVYIISDVFNYGVTYEMYNITSPMSPDDHFQDLKRVIAAIGGKAGRISVIMPMLYEGRQHRRQARESLDCAVALQELANMGVSNIITFDAHDARIQNAVPLCSFDSVRPTYQMIKALINTVDDVSLDHDDIMIVSPDEGAMSRCIYYSSVLGIDLGMFYKRRNYSVVIDGRNPIEAHEYLGRSVKGKDVMVVDDMISSGDSIIDVSRQLKEKGANRIFLFPTFGLFCNGLEIFDKAYAEGTFDRIFTTNLIYQPEELLRREWYTEVNMCKYVALLINTLNHDASISDLLDPVKRINKMLGEHNEKKASRERQISMEHLVQ